MEYPMQYQQYGHVIVNEPKTELKLSIETLSPVIFSFAAAQMVIMATSRM